MKSKELFQNFWVQFLVFWAILFFFFPSTETEIKSEMPQVGEIYPSTIISPATFDIPKPEAQLKAEQKRAREAVLPVFQYDDDRTEQLLAKFNGYKSNFLHYKKIKSEMGSLPIGPKQDSLRELAQKEFRTLKTRFSPTAMETISQNDELWTILENLLRSVLSDGINEHLIINSSQEIDSYQKMFHIRPTKVLRTQHSEVSLLRGEEEIRVRKVELLPREAALEKRFEEIRRSSGFSLRELSAIYEGLSSFTETNVFYLPKETESRIQHENDQILPSKGKVFKGMQILSAGEIVTPEHIEMMKALRKAITVEQSSWDKYLPVIGVALFTLILAFIGIPLLRSAFHRTRLRRHTFWSLLVIPIVQVLIFYFNENALSTFSNLLDNSPFEHSDINLLQPHAFSAILGALFFNFQISVMISAITAIYIGAFCGFDLFYTSLTIISSLSIAYFLQDVRYRSDLVKAWFFSGLTISIVLLAQSLFSSNFQINRFAYDLSLCWINNTLSFALSTLLFIPLLEKLFHLTTNLTLLELSDFNHPALKRISLLTPGTFNHSLMVGNLAEKASEEIDANPLLVRVMALYHDIGKTLRPEFFTENQKSSVSPHKELSPEESAQIIISHVEEAYDLAKEFRIPPDIIAGIPEHHGTGLIQYFYIKAQEIRKMEVNEQLFRYKGPKPQSKETAILMMADAIEATTRSLKEATPENLRSTVNRIINSRLYEGELDESGLTLTDLKRIEIGFLKALEGMYHTRIKYPKGVFLSAPQN